MIWALLVTGVVLFVGPVTAFGGFVMWKIIKKDMSLSEKVVLRWQVCGFFCMNVGLLLVLVAGSHLFKGVLGW